MRTQRKHKRVHASGLAAHVRTRDGFTTCAVEDISVAGAFIRTAESYVPGARIDLTLVRPGMKRALQLRAAVANVRYGNAQRMHGVGVRFEALSPSDVPRLEALLREFGLNDPAGPDAPAAQATEAGEPPMRYGELELGPSEFAFNDAPDEVPLEEQMAQMVESGGFDTARAQAANTMRDPDTTATTVLTPGKQPPARAQDAERLMLQIRGLLMELGAAQDRIAAQDNEILNLREELAATRAELARRSGRG